MTAATKRPGRVRNSNGQLDKALLSHGVLDVFRVMAKAVENASRGTGGDGSLSLSKWAKEIKGRNDLDAQMCVEVLMGHSLNQVAEKHKVRNEKVLNNLVSCLRIFHAIHGC